MKRLLWRGYEGCGLTVLSSPDEIAQSAESDCGLVAAGFPTNERGHGLCSWRTGNTSNSTACFENHYANMRR